MKINITKKVILIMALCVCCFGLAACSNDKNSIETQEKEEQSTESKKPLGNIVMKDEDGDVVITVEDIQSAETIINDNNGKKEYCVSIKFTDEGKEKFAKVTEQNIGKMISICVDDKVVSAPRVQAVISDGEAIISGSSQTYEECRELVEKIYQKSDLEESETVK